MPNFAGGEIRLVILDEESDRAAGLRCLIVDRYQLRHRLTVLGHHDGLAKARNLVKQGKAPSLQIRP